MWNLAPPANPDAPPKAIVILIGWWGAQPRQLAKYVELFTKDLQCITLFGVAPYHAILLGQKRVFQEMARQALAQVSRLLQRDHQKLAVMVHAMSNGGVMVWNQMDQILSDAVPSSPRKRSAAGRGVTASLSPRRPQNKSISESANNNNRNDNFHDEGLPEENGENDDVTETTPLHGNTNLDLVRKRLTGLMYDSAPAYPDRATFLAALDASGDNRRNRISTWLLKGALLLLIALETLWNKLTGKRNRGEVFWERVRESSFPDRQAFLYSRSDRVSPCGPLEELIAHRRSQLGENAVSVVDFEDSDHVLHFRAHPEAYRTFVSQFLDQVIEFTQSNA